MKKINIIDIGAVGGFDLPWRLHQDKIGKVLSFEPNEKPVLDGDRHRYNWAVWDFDGEASFHVSGRNGTGSSLLKQNYAWVRENFERIRHEGNPALNNTWFERSQVSNTLPCRVKKLDTVLSELEQTLKEKTLFHFLKSDTQSGEGHVLKGAESYLRNHCLALELELFRFPLYENMVLEGEVIAFLSDLGFEVAGWTGYKNSFHSQADYLFVRTSPRSQEETDMISVIKSIYSPVGPDRLIKHRTIFNRLISKTKQLLHLN